MANKALTTGDLSQDPCGTVLEFLSAEDIEGLRPYFELRNWPKGEVLMEAGEPGDFMGFILDGKLAVQKKTPATGYGGNLLAILDRGALVGEISAIERGARTATVSAMEDSRLLVISSDELDRLIEERPDLGFKIMKKIIHVLSFRQQRAYDRLAAFC